MIPAGVPRKPGMTRQDLFEVNASLNRDFANAVAKNCPKAMVAIISNPVNSTVPNVVASNYRKQTLPATRECGLARRTSNLSRGARRKVRRRAVQTCAKSRRHP